MERIDPIETLTAAAEALDKGDQEYGNALEVIAQYWSVYLTNSGVQVAVDDRGATVIQLHPIHVANMMTLFKVGRATLNPAHVDSYVDMAGYAALASSSLVTDEPEETPSEESDNFPPVQVPKLRRINTDSEETVEAVSDE